MNTHSVIAFKNKKSFIIPRNGTKKYRTYVVQAVKSYMEATTVDSTKLSES